MGIIFTRIELSVLKLLVVVIITGGWSISLMSSKQIDLAVSRMSIEAFYSGSVQIVLFRLIFTELSPKKE